MTFEQETKDISACLRENSFIFPSGILTNAAERLDAQAALIEQQAKDIETLNSVSKKMARTGMQIRNDLAEAKLKNIEQAKQIEALRTGDTCGRSCEGTAYRIELRQALAKVEQQAQEIEALKSELERERMRLAACGVVALASTKESATKAREMHDKYWSASCHDVANIVDKYMATLADIDALRGFAQDIMECWPHSELDGCDLQDIAEAHGLLKPETRTEACGENCACAEYGDFPAECYRKTSLLTGQ